MKIVILSGFPFTEQRLGVAEHVYQLIGRLAELGHNVRVISMASTTSSRNLSRNIESITIKRKWHHYIYPLTCVREIITLTESYNPEVIHLQGTMPPYVLAATNLSKRFPVLITIHGDIQEESKYKSVIGKGYARLVLMPLAKYALRSIGKVIVMSNAMRQRIKEMKPKFIYVIPNGVDIGEYSGAFNSDYAKFSYVLYMGALERLKGPDLLVRAISIAAEWNHHLKLKLAGSGTLRKILEELASYEGIMDQVEFLGFLSGKEKIRALSGASVLAIPSRFESFGIVALEAMSLGVPVIAFRVGGLEEFIEDGVSGLLVDAEDEEGLSKALIRCKESHGLRRKLGEAGRKASERYSWRAIAHKTTKVYKEVIDDFRGVIHAE